MRSPSTQAILITGASSGIGKAAAEYFAARGWRVSASMRDPAGPAGPALRALGCLTPRLDVTDAASIERALEETLAAFGRLDVLLNNAGYGLAGPLEGLSPAQLERQFATNVLGLAAMTRAALPAVRQARGVVANVSSIGGRIGFPFNSAYHATKFAVEGLSEALRFELQPHGVRVKVIEPGGIRTDFLGRSIEWASHPAYEPALSGFRTFTESLDDALPGPETVARVIWRAVHDRSGRLRYPAAPGPYLALHALLPDAVWRRMIGAALRTHARASRVRNRRSSIPARV